MSAPLYLYVYRYTFTPAYTSVVYCRLQTISLLNCAWSVCTPKKRTSCDTICEHVVYIQTGNFICSDQQQQNEIITNISLMRQRRLALCTTRQKLCNRRSKCNIETCVVGTGSARLSLGRVAGRVGDQCTQQHCSKPTSAIFCCKIHDM